MYYNNSKKSKKCENKSEQHQCFKWGRRSVGSLSHSLRLSQRCSSVWLHLSLKAMHILILPFKGICRYISQQSSLHKNKKSSLFCHSWVTKGRHRAAGLTRTRADSPYAGSESNAVVTYSEHCSPLCSCGFYWWLC